MENYTEIQKDLQVILDLFDDIEFSDLCWKLDISEERYIELLNGEGAEPTKQELENIYNFAYNRGLYLNEITWQECLDEYRNETINLGTHGSRTMIKGDIRLDVNTESNDFSTGFYVGEDISQAGMFVCEEPNASLYFLTFDTEGLNKCLFNVSTDWMLAICWFRDRLAGYENHPRIKAIRERVAECDYVVAPIADNKIFDLMDAFAAGEITDMQCLYALSATHLGYQYVMKTQKAVDHLNIIKHLYYCATEKSLYAKESDIESNTSMNKALIAKKRYGEQGKYINELLGDIIIDESLILEQALDRPKILEIGISLGEQFIKHFDKIYNDIDEGTIKHHAQEMQSWYDKVKNLVWKHNKKKLSKTDLIDIFFTVGSTPDTYLHNDTEVEVYEDFYLDLLTTNNVQESLRKVDLLNESLNQSNHKEESLKLRSSFKPKKKKKKQIELPPNGLTPIMPDLAAGTDTFNKNMRVSSEGSEGNVSGKGGGE